VTERRPRAGTTGTAAFLILAVTAFFTYAGIQLVRNALDPSSIDRTRALTAIGLGLNRRQSQNLTAIIAVTLLAMCALSAIVGIGVIARRQSMRHAAIGLYVMFSMVTLPLAVGGVLSDTSSAGRDDLPPANPWIGVLIAIVDILVVVLLVLPKTASDFERAESARMRTRQAQDRERAGSRQEREAGRA
jgi:hypothetical protein